MYNLILKRYCSGVQGAEHTLRVKKRIEEKRAQALLGGGQKRIDAQHKKVIFVQTRNRLLRCKNI